MQLRTKLEFAAVCIALAAVWYASLPDKPPVNNTTRADPAPELKGKQKTKVSLPSVPVYGGTAKTDLGLPISVQDDPNKYVLGSAKLPNDTHPHTVTTVIDAETGETTIYDRRDPLPWLAAEKRGLLQFGAGVKSGVGQVWRAAGSFDAVQIKAIHFGINGSLDSDGQAYVGAHAEYRW